MKDLLIIAAAVAVITLIAISVAEVTELPVMEIEISTQECSGMRFPPDFKLVSCVNIPENGAYEVIWVNRKTCE